MAAALVPALITVPKALANHPPQTGANVMMNRACAVSQVGVVTNITSDANDDSGSNDIVLGDDAVGTGSNITYWGMNELFTRLVVQLTQQGTSGTLKWEYWAGSWKSLPLIDPSNSFKANLGTYTLSWPPPNEWIEREIDATTCPGQYYFVRAVRDVAYGTIPKGEMVHAVEYNLRVKVTDELNNAISGLSVTAFELTEATDATIHAFRAGSGAGVYELALRGRSGSGDVEYTVRTSVAGFVRSASFTTRPLDTLMADYSGEPLLHPYALKVIVRDERGLGVAGATVRLGGTAPGRIVDEAYYFNATVGGALSASKVGYAALDTNVDKQLAGVGVGNLSQTVVTLSGEAACGNGTSVAAGASVTCRGLHTQSGNTGSGNSASSSTPRTSNRFWSAPSSGASGSYVVSNGSTVWVPAEEQFDPPTPRTQSFFSDLQKSPWGWAAVLAFLVFLGVVAFFRPRKPPEPPPEPPAYGHGGWESGPAPPPSPPQ